MRLIRLLKHDLAKEARTWVDENLISTEQAASICSRYGIDYHNHSTHSYGYYVLISLGYLFIGLSLITIIGANWEDIPRAIRMTGLLTITLFANLAGIYNYKYDRVNPAIGLFFLGAIFYGASIILIAQIYHIGEHYPDGVFWWAMGVLPFAILLQSNLIMILGVTLSFIWFFVEAGMHFYPLFFPVFLTLTAWYVLRLKQSNIVFLALIAGIGIWAESTLSWYLKGTHRFDFGPENVALGVAIFIFFHGIAKWLAHADDHRMKDYGTLLGVWTLRFAIVSLIVFSFEETWRELLSTQWEIPKFTIGLSIVLCSLAIGLSYVSGKQILSTTAFSAFYLIALFAVMTEDIGNSQSLQILDNIVMVATGVWLIMRGFHDGVSHYFYLGIITIMLTALLRYIDLVGDYIGAAILFAVFAFILLGAARYWKTNTMVEEKQS